MPTSNASHPTLGSKRRRKNDPSSRRPSGQSRVKTRPCLLCPTSSAEEISANAPLELPSATVDDWEQSLKATDPAFAQPADADAVRLQAFRKKYFTLCATAGLATQAAVAKKSGLQRSYIAVIETGDHFPQQKTLQKLAAAFGVEVGDLLP